MTSLTSDFSMVSLSSSSSQSSKSETDVVVVGSSSTTAAATLPLQQQQQPQQQQPQQQQQQKPPHISSSPLSSTSSSSLSGSSCPPSRLIDDDRNNCSRSGNQEKPSSSASSSAASASPVAGSPKQSENASGAVGGSEEGAVGGATGVSQRPVTVDDFLKMQGAQQMFAITPLSWCPHLTELRPLPSRPLNCGDPCSTCGDTSENWVCLICYKVECSRFVNEHMLYHRLETEHNLALSYSDISVWCYACDHYVDNEVLQPMKNAAHVSKFGEALPGFQ